MRRYLAIALLSLGALGIEAKAQEQIRPVLTATPSLQISPDARSAGMGDIGVATAPDINAQYWNASKLSFNPDRSGVALGYTPWLSKVVDDVALLYAGGFYKLDKAGRHTLGGSIRYFSVGKVTRWDATGMQVSEVKPNDWAFDLSYAHRLSEGLSLGVALRYIHSDQGIRDVIGTGGALVGDLSAYWQRAMRIGDRSGQWRLGVNIRNIGSKISYDKGQTESFVPTNLALGAGLSLPLASQHQLSIGVELNKLLVPMKPLRSDYSNDEAGASAYRQALEEYNDTSAISGIFKSFSDARGGFSEELKEIRYAIGAEYSYDERIYLRAGYSYLHPSKGNLQGVTAGVGLKFRGFSIDASYLISTVQNNPLDQTLRFTLGITPGAIKW